MNFGTLTVSKASSTAPTALFCGASFVSHLPDDLEVLVDGGDGVPKAAGEAELVL